MNFTKMHGLGNDFVVLDAWSSPALAALDLLSISKSMCNRHLGVGSDGLILLAHPDPRRPGADSDLAMRIFNADGSEAELCGNGLRCAARFAATRLGLPSNPLRIQTATGCATVHYSHQSTFLATVDMGEPRLDLPSIPVDADHLAWESTNGRHGINAGNEHWTARFVALGNPHAVIFESDAGPLEHATLDLLDLDRLGPAIERHPAFPRRINVHFAAVENPARVHVRTWERGSGQTLACGSGACAVVVAGVTAEILARTVRVLLPGGELRIDWDESTNRLTMTGPAEESFTGDWPGPTPS